MTETSPVGGDVVPAAGRARSAPPRSWTGARSPDGRCPASSCASSATTAPCCRGTAKRWARSRCRGPWITALVLRRSRAREVRRRLVAHRRHRQRHAQRLRQDHRPLEGRHQVGRGVDLVGRARGSPHGPPRRRRGRGDRSARPALGRTPARRASCSRRGRGRERGRAPRRSSASHVAKWQLPERWTFIDEVPKTSVGKFDKKVLRAQYADGELAVEELRYARSSPALRRHDDHDPRRLRLRTPRRRAVAARARVRVRAARRRAHRTRARRASLVRGDRSCPARSAGSSASWSSIWIAADAHPATDGFARNLFLFSLLGAMAAAVWLEFLARPGIVMRGTDRPAVGAASDAFGAPARTPRAALRRDHPHRGAQRSRPVARSRAARTTSTPSGGRPPVRRLRLALEECGGMFVKLGQVLSTRTDLISPQAAAELGMLQDHVRPAPRDGIAELLEEELDAPARARCSPGSTGGRWRRRRSARCTGRSCPTARRRGEGAAPGHRRVGAGRPVGARGARARGRDAHVVGTRVPGRRPRRRVLGPAARGARLPHRSPQRGTPSPPTLPADAHIRVPFVYEDLSTSRVLVMEWLDGASVREVDWSGVPVADRVKLADSLLRTFLEQMLQDGVFHADPHPGNVMLLADGQLALIDFGAAGRLDPVQQAALRDLMAGVSRRDADAVVQAVLQVASLRRGVDVNDFERALARFMAQHLAPGSQPDAAMFNAMLRLMFDYGITMPAEWSTFFRALIVLEGTLTTIAPGYSVIDAAESIAAQVGAQPHQPELDAAGGARRAAAHGADAAPAPAPHRPRVHEPRARRPARARVALLRRARRARRRPAGQPHRAGVPRRRASASSRSASSRSRAARRSPATRRCSRSSATSACSAPPSSPCG